MKPTLIINRDELPTWLTSDPELFYWWIDLLDLAFPDGALSTTLRELQDKWTRKWGRPSLGRISRFLTRLEQARRTEQERNKNGTRTERITICNYDSYLGQRNKNGTRTEQERNKPSDSTLINAHARISNNISLLDQSTIDKELSSSLRSEDYYIAAQQNTHTHTRTHEGASDVVRMIQFFNDELAAADSKILPVNTPSSSRIAATRLLIGKYGEEKVRDTLRRAARSPVLNGKSKSGWVATYEWIVSDEHFAGIADGNYDKLNTPNYDYSQTELSRAEAEQRARLEHYAKVIHDDLTRSGEVQGEVHGQGDNALPF